MGLSYAVTEEKLDTEASFQEVQPFEPLSATDEEEAELAALSVVVVKKQMRAMVYDRFTGVRKGRHVQWLVEGGLMKLEVVGTTGLTLHLFGTAMHPYGSYPILGSFGINYVTNMHGDGTYKQLNYSYLDGALTEYSETSDMPVDPVGKSPQQTATSSTNNSMASYIRNHTGGIRARDVPAPSDERALRFVVAVGGTAEASEERVDTVKAALACAEAGFTVADMMTDQAARNAFIGGALLWAADAFKNVVFYMGRSEGTVLMARPANLSPQVNIPQPPVVTTDVTYTGDTTNESRTYYTSIPGGLSESGTRGGVSRGFSQSVSLSPVYAYSDFVMREVSLELLVAAIKQHNEAGTEPTPADAEALYNAGADVVFKAEYRNTGSNVSYVERTTLAPRSWTYNNVTGVGSDTGTVYTYDIGAGDGTLGVGTHSGYIVSACSPPDTFTVINEMAIPTSALGDTNAMKITAADTGIVPMMMYVPNGSGISQNPDWYLSNIMHACSGKAFANKDIAPVWDVAFAPNGVDYIFTRPDAPAWYYTTVGEQPTSVNAQGSTVEYDEWVDGHLVKPPWASVRKAPTQFGGLKRAMSARFPQDVYPPIPAAYGWRVTKDVHFVALDCQDDPKGRNPDGLKPAGLYSAMPAYDAKKVGAFGNQHGKGYLFFGDDAELPELKDALRTAIERALKK